MKILVVEDNAANIQAAKVMLAGHDLTIVSGFDQALELLKRISAAVFDAVLTDVMLPKGGDKCMNEEGMRLVREQGEMPYGPIIAFLGIQKGIKKIGIITMGNHHTDPFVFAFDWLRGSFTLEGIKVVISNQMTEYVEEGSCKRVGDSPSGAYDRPAYDEWWRRWEKGEIIQVKDWDKLLQTLLEP